MRFLTMDRRGFLGGAMAAVAAYPLRGVAAQVLGAGGAVRAIPRPINWPGRILRLGCSYTLRPTLFRTRKATIFRRRSSAINPDIDTDNWAECAVNLRRRIHRVCGQIRGRVLHVADGDNEVQHRQYAVEGRARRCAGRPGRFRAGSMRLRLGVYLSPRDDYFGAGVGGVCKDPGKQDAYNAIYRQQLTEVLTRYGQMVEVWFDGSSVVPSSDLVRKYAAHAAIFQGPDATIRWVGNENGFAPYPLWNAESKADARSGTSTSLLGDPDGDAWVPVECDVSIRRPNWFWSTTNERNLMTLDQLMEVYYRSVGRGAQSCC